MDEDPFENGPMDEDQFEKYKLMNFFSPQVYSRLKERKLSITRVGSYPVLVGTWKSRVCVLVSDFV